MSSWSTDPNDTSPCRGCNNDFYNGNNELGIKRCWSLDEARLVTRYRIAVDVRPDVPGAFTSVIVPNCYRQKGQSFSAEVPDFVDLGEVRWGKIVILGSLGSKDAP